MRILGQTLLAIAALMVVAYAQPELKDPRLSSRPARMEQWRSWRYGLFIHWGPYSKLGGTYEGKRFPGNTEWIMKYAGISRQDYRKVAGDFDPKQYDPAALVAFAKQCGFKYIILTVKHYDGFALFDSQVDDFDSVDLLPSKRDLLRELVKACEEAKMPLGFCYALDRDWYHSGGDTGGPFWDVSQEGSRNDYLEKVALPQVKELLSNYGTVPVMMFGNGPPPPASLAARFMSALGSGVITSRDFIGGAGGDYTYTDGLPIGANYSGDDWEQCESINDSWGFRKEPSKWQPADALLHKLVSTATRGGNFLLNVGLNGGGAVPQQAQERLSVIGDWLVRYGKSIYGTERSPFSRHPWSGGATVRDDGNDGWKLYLHFFQKPDQNLILPNLITQPRGARLMSSGAEIPVKGVPGAWMLDLSGVDLDGLVPVIEVSLPSRPLTGNGPICKDRSGNYVLGIGRAKISGKNITIGRTQSSADLRVTGFEDGSESAAWEVYAEQADSIVLKIQTTLESVANKKLMVFLNGEKVDSFAAASAPEGDSAIKSNGGQFISKSFRLKVGMNQVMVSGSSDEEHHVPVTVVRATLFKN